MKTFDALIKSSFRRYICSIKSADKYVKDMKLRCLKLVDCSFFPQASPKLENSLVNVTPHRVKIDRQGLTDFEKMKHIEDFLNRYYYIYVTNSHDNLKCPVCLKKFSIAAATSYEYVKYCTTDCPNCEALLYMSEEGVEPFHRRLNRISEGVWPRNGAGCGYIEF